MRDGRDRAYCKSNRQWLRLPSCQALLIRLGQAHARGWAPWTASRGFRPIRQGHVEDIHVHRQAAFNDQSPLEGPLAVERRRLALAMGVTDATGRFC